MEMTRRKLLNGDRFLSFTVDNECYGMDILKVKELMGMTTITPLPRTQDFIRGVINLRGQIIPIIDLRLKFGLPFREYSKRTSIIVVEVTYEEDQMLMGIVVDAIQEVISIPAENLSKIPYINARINAEYIKGVANTQEGIVIILDVLKILSGDELSAVKATTSLSNTEEHV